MYQNFKEIKQQKVNKMLDDADSYFIAFTNENFYGELEKRNLKENDLISIAPGAFITPAEVRPIINYINEMLSIQEFLIFNNVEFMKSAFYYEAANHEYFISGDFNTVLDALSITPAEYKNTPKEFKQRVADVLEKYEADTAKIWG